MGERRRFFEDLLLLRPELNVVQAIREVKKRYGISVDPKYAQEAYAVARGLQGIELKKKPEQKPKLKRKEPHLEYRKPAETEEEAARYLVTQHGGPVSVDNFIYATGDDKLRETINSLIKQGVRPDFIKVFKRIKTDIKVDIKVSF